MRRLLLVSIAGVLAVSAQSADAASAVGPMRVAEAAVPKAAPPATTPGSAHMPSENAAPTSPGDDRMAPGTPAMTEETASAHTSPAPSSVAGPADSLTDALVAAYTTNPNLLAARAQLRALDETLPQASAGWKPTITLTGQYGYSDSRTGFTQGGLPPTASNITKSHPLQGTAQVTQPIFRGGRTYFGVKEAQHNVEAGRARLQTTEQQTFLDVVSAYFNVIRDTATVDLNTNNVQVLQKQLDSTQDQFDVGELTRTDVAQAQARLKLAETQLIASQAQLVASRDAYKTVVGHPPGVLQNAPDLPALPPTIEDAQAEAARNSPSLMAARETEKASNAAVKVAVGALLPSVSVVGQLSHSEGQKSSFGPGNSFDIHSNQSSVQAQVTVPIYQAGAEYASVRSAKHTASQDRLLTAQTIRTVEENVANAWEQLRAARAAIRSNQEQVKANEIAYEGVVQEERVGSRTTLDVLNAEQELLNSQVSLVQSERDQYVAAYSLLAAIGGLTAQKLSLPVSVYDPTANSRSLLWKQFWPGAGERSE